MSEKSRRRPLFEVRHSKVHGYGVFALRRIRKGTVVMEYIGDRISHAEADTRYENKAADDNHTFLFTVDARTVIDGGVGGNDARYINHGCDPNCESSTANRRVFIEAIRTIQEGEELAYDYQIQRDRDDPPNVDEIFACRCGAAACRGSMLEARKVKRPRLKKKRAATRKHAAKRKRAAKRKAAPVKTKARARR
jgi:SET domain-containing protein